MARGGLRSTSFKPGQSGNPKGRPSIPVDVKEASRAHTVEAIKILGEIMKNAKVPSAARVSAAQTLLDRGWGKAPQTIDATVNFIDQLSDVEQRSLLAALAALSGEPGEAGDGTPTTH